MTSTGRADRSGPWPAVGLIVMLLVVAGVVRWTSGTDTGVDADGSGRAGSAPPLASISTPAETPAEPPATSPGKRPAKPPAPSPAPSPAPPAGGIFDDGRFLVAYYGTAQTGALGVLGETDPDRAFARLKRAAASFARPAQPVRLVFELIVTVADAAPGPRGVYSHDIPRAEVERYVAAARRHGVLLLLDVQPGRDDFLSVAQRWAWALRDPRVGLALDPEWRMGRHQVPGRSIGSVDATEVNGVSRWLVDLQARHSLPQKLFVLHQFRADMIERIGQIQPRDSLAMVQHVDGFGTPEQKRATFHAVAEPKKFVLGFKLFYDEDTRLMSADAVHRLRPKVRFVSFQ